MRAAEFNDARITGMNRYRPIIFDAVDSVVGFLFFDIISVGLRVKYVRQRTVKSASFLFFFFFIFYHRVY